MVVGAAALLIKYSFLPARESRKALETQVAALEREIEDSKKFCFARVTLDQGKSITAGDSASTNLTGARGN